MGPWYAANTNSIAYCWAETPGFTKFGKYNPTDSESAAPFIYCGFKPALVIVKAIGASDSGGGNTNWALWDRERTPGTLIDNRLEMDTSNFQGGDGRTAGDDIRMFSNGFSITTEAWWESNYSGAGPYIYAAFSEEAITKTLGAE